MRRFAIITGTALASLCVTACHNAPAAEHSGDADARTSPEEEQNAQLARRFMERVWDAGDLAAIDELVAPGYIDHSAEGEGDARENLRALVSGIHGSFSDVSFHVDLVVAQGDLVALRFTSSFVQSGEYMGIAPTGRRIETSGIDIYRFADGRIVEEWEAHDRLGMLTQMGVVSLSGASDAGSAGASDE